MSEETNNETVEETVPVDQIEEALTQRQEDMISTALETVKTALQQARTEIPAEDTARKVLAEETAQQTRQQEDRLQGVSDLRDARYSTLPKWQRDVGRNHETDKASFDFLRALASNDYDKLQSINREDEHKRAALAEGASSSGGVFNGTGGQLLPLPMANLINNILYKRARMRQIALVIQSPAASIRLPVQGSGATVAWTAEAATLSDASGAYNQGINLVKKNLTNLSTSSNELLEDSPFAVANWITEDVGGAMAQAEDVAFMTSAAAGDVTKGLETEDVAGTSTSEVDLASATVVTYDDVVKMFFTLEEGSRFNANWFANDQVLIHLSGLLANGRPVFQFASDPSAVLSDAMGAPGAVGTLLGRPVFNLPGASSTSTTADTNRLYLSNTRKHYAILDGGDIRAAVSTEAGFTSNSTLFRFVRRVDGAVYDANDRHYVFADNIQSNA